MEKIHLKFQDAENAHITFQDILKEPFSTIVRDAAIQRFEYTFEAIWKCAKEYLSVIHGVQENSPKRVFRALFQTKTISESLTIKLLEITDRRNETCHTYKVILADAIYKELPEIEKAFQEILTLIKKEI